MGKKKAASPYIYLPQNIENWSLENIKAELENIDLAIQQQAMFDKDVISQLIEMSSYVKSISCRSLHAFSYAEVLRYAVAQIPKDNLPTQLDNLRQKVINLIEALKSDIPQLRRLEEAYPLIEKLKDGTRGDKELQRTVNELQELIVQAMQGAETKEPRKPTVDDVIQKDKQSELYRLAKSLEEVDDRTREGELEKIYQEIPEYRGVRKDGSALEFVNLHWQVWIKLGWANKKNVRRHSGELLVKQAEKEIRDKGLEAHLVLPSIRTISSRNIQSLSEEQIRAVNALHRRDYRNRKKVD